MPKAKACGKVILIGEHFVVAGAPALALPLRELFCEVKVDASAHPHCVAVVPGNENREEIENLMSRAVYAAIDAFRMDPKAQAFRIESKSNFPISRGLGSSASFAVALTRAFDAFRKSIVGENADWAELVKATTAVERIFHGSPSGIDAATIMSERPIRFENGAILREVRNVAVDLVVVDGGDREGCASLVKQVIAFRERNAEPWRRMTEVVRGLVDACEAGLAAGDASAVGRCLNESHAILSELGLSTPTIDAIIADGQEFGAVAGKVSGAGGGGAVVLVAPRGRGRDLARAMRGTGRLVLATDEADGGLRG